MLSYVSTDLINRRRMFQTLDVYEYLQHWICDHFTYALRYNTENLFLNNITIFLGVSLCLFYARMRMRVRLMSTSIFEHFKSIKIKWNGFSLFQRRRSEKSSENAFRDVHVVHCTLFSKVPKFSRLFVSIIKFAKSDHKFPHLM